MNGAAIQNNLGIALLEQGIFTVGPEGADLLAHAVAAFREVLQIYTRADDSVHWAQTNENLAIADHDTATDPRLHLVAALEHVEAALSVYDPEHMSFRYEQAIALRDQITKALADL